MKTRRLLGPLLGLVLCGRVWGLGPVSYVNSVSATTSAFNAFISYTTGSTTPILFVGVGENSGTITAISWDSLPLTKLASIPPVSNVCVGTEAWYLTNAPALTTALLAISFTAGSQHNVSIAEYTGENTKTPFVQYVTGVATAASCSLSITTQLQNSVILNVIGYASNFNTLTASFTQRQNPHQGTNGGNELYSDLFTTFPTLNNSYSTYAGVAYVAQIMGELAAAPASTTFNYLCVGGGGGGGQTSGNGSGGGGAADVETGTAAISTSQSIVVGTGGTAGSGSAGGTGSNSTFGSLVTAYGGGGGGASGHNPTSGGSGGGGQNSGSQAGAAAGNGSNVFAGGPGVSGTGGGGGGGASAIGGTPSTNGGAGGTGYTSTITGSSVVYGGGGGGQGPTGHAGPGGSGGGGTGGAGIGNATNGTTNMGGGGGGSDAGTAGSGGSGIVILAEPMGQQQWSCNNCITGTAGTNWTYTFDQNGMLLAPTTMPPYNVMPILGPPKPF